MGREEGSQETPRSRPLLSVPALSKQTFAEADAQGCEIQQTGLVIRARLCWSRRPHLKRPRPGSQVGLRTFALAPSAQLITSGQVTKAIK